MTTAAAAQITTENSESHGILEPLNSTGSWVHDKNGSNLGIKN